MFVILDKQDKDKQNLLILFLECDILYLQCRYGLVVEYELPKLWVRVRFPLPAPIKKRDTRLFFIDFSNNFSSNFATLHYLLL